MNWKKKYQVELKEMATESKNSYFNHLLTNDRNTAYEIVSSNKYQEFMNKFK